MDPALFGRGRGTESGEHVIIKTQCCYWEGGDLERKTRERDSDTDRKKKEEGQRKVIETHRLLCILLNILTGTQPETELGANGILEVTSDL